MVPYPLVIGKALIKPFPYDVFPFSIVGPSHVLTFGRDLTKFTKIQTFKKRLGTFYGLARERNLVFTLKNLIKITYCDLFILIINGISKINQLMPNFFSFSKNKVAIHTRNPKLVSSVRDIRTNKVLIHDSNIDLNTIVPHNQ